MTLSRRGFPQVLGAAGSAGLALGQAADADAATAQRRPCDLRPFANVSLLAVA